MVVGSSHAKKVSQTMELVDDSSAPTNNIGIIAATKVGESEVKVSVWDAEIELWYLPRIHQVQLEYATILV